MINEFCTAPKLGPGPFAVDFYIREAGFEIIERPKGGAPRWKRGGHEYTHGEAYAIAHREEPKREAAKEAEKKKRESDRKGKS